MAQGFNFSATVKNPENTGRASNIQFNGTLATLSRNCERHGFMVNQVTGDIGDTLAEEAHHDMRDHAPWTDQSGFARSSLFARCEHDDRTHRITMGYDVGIISKSPSYRMPYNLVLEFGHGGRYAIVGPVSTRIAFEYMRECRRFMGNGRR
jgi:hypothetical protein